MNLKSNPLRWVNRDEKLEVKHFILKRGYFYVGTEYLLSEDTLVSSNLHDEVCLFPVINTSLSISQIPDDYEGHFKCYNDMSPYQRYLYLIFLSSDDDINNEIPLDFYVYYLKCIEFKLFEDKNCTNEERKVILDYILLLNIKVQKTALDLTAWNNVIYRIMELCICKYSIKISCDSLFEEYLLKSDIVKYFAIKRNIEREGCFNADVVLEILKEGHFLESSYFVNVSVIKEFINIYIQGLDLDSVYSKYMTYSCICCLTDNESKNAVYINCLNTHVEEQFLIDLLYQISDCIECCLSKPSLISEHYIDYILENHRLPNEMINIKSVKEVFSHDIFLLSNEKLYIVEILVDDITYSIYIRMTSDEYEMFASNCLDLRIYKRLPRKGFVPLPNTMELEHTINLSEQDKKYFKDAGIFTNNVRPIVNERNKFMFSLLPVQTFLNYVAAYKKYKIYKSNLDEYKKLIDKGSHYEALNKIDDAIECYEKCVSKANKDFSVTPFDRLSVLYKKRNDKESEIEVLRKRKSLYGVFNSQDKKMSLRLLKLENQKSSREKIFPTHRFKFELDCEPIGDKIYRIRKKIEKELYERENIYSYEESDEIRDLYQKRYRLDNVLTKWLDEAKQFEIFGNYKAAACEYEKLVAHHFDFSKAYDRLIVIYKQAGLYEIAKEVILEAINQKETGSTHFTQNKNESFFEKWKEQIIKIDIILCKKQVKKNSSVKECQISFVPIQNEMFGNILATIFENRVYFRGKDICRSMGYVDNTNALQKHCLESKLLECPILTKTGVRSKRKGIFIPIEDIRRLVHSNSMFADDSHLNMLRSFLTFIENEYQHIILQYDGISNHQTEFSIDYTKLKELEKETEESQNILSKIFDSEVEEKDQLDVNSNNSIVHELLELLFTKRCWEKKYIEHICDKKGYVVNSILEDINDYSYSILEDSVIEEDNGLLYVELNYKSKLL